MKKLLEWWKIWTMLSIVVFVMTCWILAHGFWWDPTQSPFSDWRIDKQLGNTLDDLEWNYLMTKLDTLGGVPAWAVMAFNLNKCPTWWHEYTAARGRFIMGKGYYDTLGDVGGNSYVYLQIDQMPAHAHYMVAKWAKNSSQYVYDHDGMNYPDYPLAYEDDHDDSGSDGDFSYTLAAYPGKAEIWKTSTAWWYKAVDLLNPYIKLIYCEKE